MGQLFEPVYCDLRLGLYDQAALQKGRLLCKEEGVVHEAHSEKVHR